MIRRGWVIGSAVAAAAAYIVYGMTTGRGIIGWLNYAQQSVFGSYSQNTSLLVMITVLALAGALVWGLLERAAERSHDGLLRRFMLGPEAVPDSSWQDTPKMFLAVWLGMVAVTWVIGLGYYAWSTSEQREDASARYEPIVLVNGSPPLRPAGTHVALQGRLLLDRVLTHRSGSGSSAHDAYHLVPMVAPGWLPGQAVTFIVQVKSLSDLPGEDPPGLPAPGEAARQAHLLARLDGEVEVPAAQEFRKMEVPLAPYSRLARLVPSNGGRADVRDTSADDWVFTLVMCGGISVLLTFFVGVMAWKSARQRKGANVPGRRA